MLRSRFRKTASAACMLALAGVSGATASRADNGAITGIYMGSMHLVDGAPRDIPLAVSLVLTDERVSTPTGYTYVIDGVFVVDNEGGPYAFTQIIYDLDNNRIDMKYSRPRGDPTSTSPAAYRLIGTFGNDGLISGAISTGTFGRIGTFSIKRDEALQSLPYTRKYLGVWEGMAQNINHADPVPVKISLSPAISSNTNPPGYEFDFTPGLEAGYTFNGIWVGSFNSVAIDYLRRHAVLTSTNDGITVEFNIDFATNTISGSQSSHAFGTTTTFTNLKKTQ